MNNSIHSRVTFFTGGTTKVPRMVCYDQKRWNKSVEVTTEILKIHGVGKNSKVLVGHPFAPWAIGQIFCEAALRCGAHVYPLGLYFLDRNFSEIFTEIRFTHICSTIRNLLTWLNKYQNGLSKPLVLHPEKVFVAGEKLSVEARTECSERWHTEVIDIYGMSEFDTVAAEMPFSKSMVLSPHLRYALLIKSKVSRLKSGTRGELLIKHLNNKGDWHRTGDIVDILDKDDNGIWKGSYKIEFINRLGCSVTLSDGSKISAWQIEHLLRKFNFIENIQCNVKRSPEGDSICLFYKSKNSLSPNFEEFLISEFISSSVDFADSIKHKIVTSVDCKRAYDDTDFVSTQRGKIPMFVFSEFGKKFV